MRVMLMAATVAAMAAGVAGAEVAADTKVLGDFSVTLHTHPFLTPEELTTLRLVQTNAEALAIFVPEAAAGHAAMAAAPGEGFIRDGNVVPSAVAIAGMADAGSAAKAALEGCEAARKGGDACVVVLEVAPAQ